MGDSPILSESGFGSPASEVSLEESDVPIIVWDTREGSNSERIGSRNRTVYFGDELGDSPIPSEFGFRLRIPASDSGFGNPFFLE